tara:strand:+ start:3043 stop:3633 length:591 start_codon:yes stop_codon:yes gene_type:complete
MNWWDVIKNQIASTKGKQFQLDFNQPMIEDEENCKEKLRAILKKFWELDFKQFLKKDIDFDDGYSSNEYKVNSATLIEEGVYVSFARTNFQSESLDAMSEEVACWFLENLKNDKQTTFTEDKGISSAEVRFQEIQKDNRFLYSIWYNISKPNTLALHTSIVIEKRNPDTPVDKFLLNARKYVDFDKLYQTIRNIIG